MLNAQLRILACHHIYQVLQIMAVNWPNVVEAKLLKKGAASTTDHATRILINFCSSILDCIWQLLGHTLGNFTQLTQLAVGLQKRQREVECLGSLHIPLWRRRRRRRRYCKTLPVSVPKRKKVHRQGPGSCHCTGWAGRPAKINKNAQNYSLHGMNVQSAALQMKLK